MNVTLARKAETVRGCGSRPAQRIGRPIAATTNRLPPIIQAKLRISSPTDKYEREANRVAIE